MSFFMSLILKWQNAIYFGPMVFSLIYLSVFWLGFDGTSSVEAETDLELEAEIDTDIDVEADTDVDVDVDTDTQIKPSIFSHGVIHDALSFLGVGRCPFSIILITLSLFWGFYGLSFNALFSKFIPLGLYILPSLFCATILGLGTTRLISMFIAKHLSQGTTAIKLESLVGHRGEASMKIDTFFGRATVRDKFGTLHNIDCKVPNGEKPILVNTEVIVLQYLPKSKMFIVRKKPKILKFGEEKRQNRKKLPIIEKFQGEKE